VPQTDVPGEKTSPTQPFVTKPPPYSRTYIAESDLIDFTPALRQRAIDNLTKGGFRWEPTPFVPPSWAGPGAKWPGGAVNIGNLFGGINWPGGAFDPETAIFYGQAGNANVSLASYGPEELALVGPEAQAKNRIPWWESPYGREGRPSAAGRGAGAAPAGDGRGAGAGGGRGVAAAAGAGVSTVAAQATGAALTSGLQGFPLVKPPYGVLAAIDLNTGTLKFQVPNGDTPDNYRTAFQRLGINYTEKTGQSGIDTGVMVTKTMVVLGDLVSTSPPGRPAGAMMRAYDKQTGKEIGAVLMPSRVSGSPMTYLGSDGRQYINIAVNGVGVNAGQYVTYALPASEIRP
jgi:quinoprotein glucose dehydrogenase